MLEFLQPSLLKYSLISFIGSFLLTFYLIPRIIRVVHHKELMDHPNSRSSHVNLTPTFGGISFYISIILILLFLGKNVDGDAISLNIIAGITILLFTGLKDDLVVISNFSKLIGQISAVSVFLFEIQYNAINFYGAFGLGEINGVIGFFALLLLMLSIINAFNLIDGIDGLAALTGVIVLIAFSVIYYHLNEIFFTVLCLGMIGCLLAFLRFNFSKSKKIFMGDTGSMILGFLVAVMSVKFLSLNHGNFEYLGMHPHNAVFILIAILIFPFFDMARVFLLRIMNRKNPFVADKNHTHHILLSLGNTHTTSSLLISVFSILVMVGLLFATKKVDNSWTLCGIYLLTFLAFYLTILRFTKANKKV